MNTMQLKVQGSEQNYPFHERVFIVAKPRFPGQTEEQREIAFAELVMKIWDSDRIPVIAWGCELDGKEILPQSVH